MLVLKFSFLILIIAVKSETKCLTLSGKSGHCINLRKCEGILRIVEQKPLPFINKLNFKLVQCGLDESGPKVCCEKPEEKKNSDNYNERNNYCLTLWGTRGSCRDIRNCTKILDHLTGETSIDDLWKILGKSECGTKEHRPQVCCDLEENLSGNLNPIPDVSNDENYCITPVGDSGVCINIKHCEEISALLEKKTLTSADLKQLYKSRCGLEGEIPNVCCRFDGIIPESSTKVSKYLKLTTDFLIDHPNLRLLDHKLCGTIKPVPRVFGGTDASINEFPWMALLGYHKETDGKKYFGFYCDASLINEKYVLTVAHCVTNLEPGRILFNVRIGENDLTSTIDCDSDDVCADKYQDFEVESVWVHPNYTSQNYDNDIAIIRLKGKVNMKSKNVRPICLPLNTANSNYDPPNFIVTGWGTTEFGLTSRKLQKARLPLVEKKICEAAYKNHFSQSFEIPSKPICAGGLEDIDSCVGDSGGPLQAIGAYNNRMSFVQYGIVSFGITPCGVRGLPGIYTRVADYVEWILDNMTE